MAQCYAMVLADNSALQQSPKPFNRIGVNFTIHVMHLMVDGFVGHESLNVHVAHVLVCNECGSGYIDIVSNELVEALGFQLALFNWTGNNPATALNNPNNGNFRGTATARVVFAIRPNAALARLPADIGFVHLTDALQQFALLEHRIANPHPHVPSGVLVDSQIAAKLPCRDALPGIKNERDGKKPFLQGQMRMVKDRVHRDAKRGVAGIAVMPLLARKGSSFGRFAVWADRNAMPANSLKVGDAISFGRESLVNLDNVHGYLWLGRLGQNARTLSIEILYRNLGHSAFKKQGGGEVTPSPTFQYLWSAAALLPPYGLKRSIKFPEKHRAQLNNSS
jgi:hypothetical protein